MAALVREGRKTTQTGDKVLFRISDIFLPSPDALSFKLAEAEELEGTIMDFSDSGQKERVFAIVDVVMRKTVVVPVEKLKAVADQG